MSIIIKISAQAIKIPDTPKMNLRLANWENFREELNNQMEYVNANQHMNKEVLEKSIKTWIKFITEAINNNIIITTQKTEQKEINNQRIKLL